MRSTAGMEPLRHPVEVEVQARSTALQLESRAEVPGSAPILGSVVVGYPAGLAQ